jgi:hypothetical protein
LRGELACVLVGASSGLLSFERALAGRSLRRSWRVTSVARARGEQCTEAEEREEG